MLIEGLADAAIKAIEIAEKNIPKPEGCGCTERAAKWTQSLNEWKMKRLQSPVPLPNSMDGRDMKQYWNQHALDRVNHALEQIGKGASERNNS